MGGHTGTPQIPEWPSNPYFGEPWDVPAVEGARQAPTPVGQPCAWCTVSIADGDQGFLIGCARLDEHGNVHGSVKPFHRECLLRSTVGSPAHLDGECSCNGGEGNGSPSTPEGKRAEAIAVWDRIRSGRVGARRPQ